MKTKRLSNFCKLFKLGSICLVLTSCNLSKKFPMAQAEKEWYSGYELRLEFGKEKAKQLIANACASYTKENKTIRDNMRTGNIEYKIKISENVNQ